VVNADPLFEAQRDQHIALAARHAVPTIYQTREDTAAGGLMNYGTSQAVRYRAAGVYVGCILNGEQPGDPPVQGQTKIELIMNMKTAKALGVTVPPSVLVLADE
jgi:putative tryptophan/tyrosine transport system substrate-binding protein